MSDYRGIPILTFIKGSAGTHNAFLVLVASVRLFGLVSPFHLGRTRKYLLNPNDARKTPPVPDFTWSRVALDRSSTDITPTHHLCDPSGKRLSSYQLAFPFAGAPSSDRSSYRNIATSVARRQASRRDY